MTGTEKTRISQRIFIFKLNFYTPFEQRVKKRKENKFNLITTLDQTLRCFMENSFELSITHIY